MFGAVVEVSKGYCNADFHVRASALTRSMTEVATTAKEAREEIERVSSLTVSTFFVLFEAFVAVLIVDFARLGFDEGFVCFGDFDEFLL